MSKKCTKCLESKSIDEFYAKNGRGKGTSQCKNCIRSKQILYRRTRPDKAKDVDLYQSFGIRLVNYNKMFESQSGKCAICSRHQSELSRTLAVDHCHETGRIRSLLCQQCNQGLGNFRDKIESLHGAISYLTFHFKQDKVG